MNQLLVRGLRDLNAMIAIAITVLGAVASYKIEHHWGGTTAWRGTAVGFVFGLVTAAAVNGLIAVAIQIEMHLREIKESLRQRPV